MKQLILLSIIILCISCSKKENSEQKEIKGSNSFVFLNNYKLENVPLKDSTNFDNYLSPKKLSKEQMRLLGMNQITKSKKLNEINNASIRYRLNISKNFNTVVISFQNGENELFTVLVNYSHEYSVIDWRYISYDEIAESTFRTESEISSNQLVVIDKNYSNEIPEIEKTNFTIRKDGKFEKQRASL